MTLRSNTTHLAFFCIFALSIIGVSCSAGLPFLPQPTATPTPLPTPTPTPLPNRVVLVATSGDDAAASAEAQQKLSGLAAASGWEFETRSDAGTVSPDVKVMVFLSQPANLGSLANTAPDTQFVAISDQDWKPGANVTIIKLRADHLAFTAGFIAEMLAPNYRAGALLPSEDAAFIQAFSNGARYFCGICLSTINPYSKYPLTASNPAGSAASTWQASFDQINAGKVQVLFVSPQAASPELMSYLANQNVVVFGTQVVLGSSARWAGTLTVNGMIALQEIWPDLLAGRGGRVVNASIRISDNQPQTLMSGEIIWLSEGKIALVEKLMEKLRADLIFPLDIAQ